MKVQKCHFSTQESRCHSCAGWNLCAGIKWNHTQIRPLGLRWNHLELRLLVSDVIFRHTCVGTPQRDLTATYASDQDFGDLSAGS
jgi:hypothetical protein